MHKAFLLSAVIFLASASVAAEPQQLDGYNYVITWDKGQIVDVHISGENGSGLGAPLFTYDEQTPPPARYRQSPPGSVRAVTLPTERLLSMALGEKVLLNLPEQNLSYVHDNRFEHGNGDVTWVGRLEDAKEWRALLTFGPSGLVLGQIDTGSNQYLLENQDGHSYLVDLKKSGLSATAMAEDTINSAGGGGTTPPPTSGGTEPVTLDLLVLYSRRLSNPQTRINQLVALSNQAYIDSRINLSLRLVGTQLVRYTERNKNTKALSDLTASRGRLSRTKSLRTRLGADLVSLIRPFYRSAQSSCGTAWVNGVRGTPPQARYGFSVISDGTDQLGAPYYCNSYALAHEIGHNLGSAHDHEHSPAAGAYAFSFGYKLPLSGYGTIMSYYNPRIGYFSNPRLDCFDEPCGVEDYADNARSIGLVAPAVAAFLPKVVP